MAKRRILVIEDDPAVREGIVDMLTFEGFHTFEATNVTDAVRMGVQVDCDLILLDLVLPSGEGPQDVGHPAEAGSRRRDGLDVLAEIRLARPTLPVIILTARGQEEDRVKGLRLGADDYQVKPFSIKELLARVEAVLRRSAERPTDLAEVAFPFGVADLERAELRFTDGEKVELSEKEIALLRYLALNQGRVITRDELLTRVWRLNASSVKATRTIDMHVARLRDKLRDSDARIIATVRGKGYVFDAGAG